MLASFSKPGLFIFLFAFSFLNSTAQDFSGTWQGMLQHSDRSFKPQNYYHITVQLHQKGRAVWGIIKAIDSLRNFDTCACKISGQFNKKNKVDIDLFNAGAVLPYRYDHSFCLAFASMKVHYLKKDNQQFLKGTWYGSEPSTRTDNASGVLALVKRSDATLVNVDNYFPDRDKLIIRENRDDTSMREQVRQMNLTAIPIKDREMMVVKEMVVDKPQIEIELYDNGVADADSVSLFLNEKAIVQNCLLTSNAKKLTLTLDRNKDNQLLIAADNLGNIPPNTGIVVVRTNSGFSQIPITTSFRQNAAIVIRVKK